jgi:membrane-associated protein
VLGMRAGQFFLWSLVVALAWTEAILLAGHVPGAQLGAAFPIDKYLLPAIAIIVVISVRPVVGEVIKVRRESSARVE